MFRRAPKGALMRSPRPPLDHGTQLLEGNIGVDLGVAGKGSEPAISTCDHPLAADDVSELADALGNELGMLDIVGRGSSTPGIRILSFGSFTSCDG